MRTLDALLTATAAHHPELIAAEDCGEGTLTYQELDGQSGALAEQLRLVGVRPGDRVGIYAPKCLATVIAIFGILKTGAAYVPVDPLAPPSRNAYIFQDCAVKAVLVDSRLLEGLQAACPDVRLAAVDLLQGPESLGCTLRIVVPAWPPSSSVDSRVEDLAYILYTSGSTGKPKGVMHSHATALSFIDWCSTEFGPTETDRFSSHAPFHFDLSILDLYVPIKHGARVVLIGEDIGKQPLRLAPLIDERGITVWYSTPSILRLLVEFGHLEQHPCETLRLVLFAGEVFPVKHLRALQTRWPQPRYCNLYGPTETNVCTWYEAPSKVPDDRVEPLPIGWPCSGDTVMVVDGSDQPLEKGQEGELLVAGGSVMLGYWNLPEQNARAFHVDAGGVHWYRTGDVVREGSDGSYVYLGRRDRMVKRRGFRVELGEIESVLYRHPSIAEVAVIALPDEDSGVQLRAYLTWRGEEQPSQVALKRFSSENLTPYMIPDRFIVLPSLPKTSTDKTDYQKLKEIG
jgi:amino acid adenylation domain-containing protein